MAESTSYDVRNNCVCLYSWLSWTVLYQRQDLNEFLASLFPDGMIISYRNDVRCPWTTFVQQDLIVTIEQSKAFPAFVVLFFCFDTSSIAIVMSKTYLQYTLNKYFMRLWGLNLITAVKCISCYSMALLICLVYCSCYRYIHVIFEQVLELDFLYKVVLWKRGSPFDRPPAPTHRERRDTMRVPKPSDS